MKRTVCLFLLLLLWALPTATLWADAGNIKKPLIAVLLSFSNAERWEKDLAAMRDYARARDIGLVLEVVQDNQMHQNSQAVRVLAQRPDVLILTPHDAASSAFIVAKAQAQGTKVIAYDRLVLNAGVDLYIGFDNEEVGRLQAAYLLKRAPAGNYIIFSGAPGDYNSRLILNGVMELLEPRISEGRVKVLAQGPIVEWQQSEIGNLMRPPLEKGLEIAAVVTPDDLSAGEAVAFLASFGQAGKTLVAGQDALVFAARRIVMGTQALTIFKDSRNMGTLAMDLAVKMAAGHDVSGRASRLIFDGVRDIPSVILPPLLIDGQNIQEQLISPGHITREQVYGRQVRTLPGYGH